VSPSAKTSDGRNVRVVIGAQPRVAALDRRRQEQIDRFVNAVPGADHRVDRGVEVVGIRRVGRGPNAAGFEPGAVAGNRVDLAVVRDVPERLHQPPRRRTIGRKALVEEREARGERGVAQVVEIRTEFVRREQRLVHHGCGRTREQRRRAPEFPKRAFERARRAAHPFADVARTHVDQKLFEERPGHAGLRAEEFLVNAGRAPTQRRDLRGPDADLDRCPCGRGRIGFARQEHADRRQMIGRGMQIG
jgi:hypothetical protein